MLPTREPPGGVNPRVAMPSKRATERKTRLPVLRAAVVAEGRADAEQPAGRVVEEPALVDTHADAVITVDRRRAVRASSPRVISRACRGRSGRACDPLRLGWQRGADA